MCFIWGILFAEVGVHIAFTWLPEERGEGRGPGENKGGKEGGRKGEGKEDN